MKKSCVVMICSFLLAGYLSTILDNVQDIEIDQVVAIGQCANKHMLEAESRAMEQCHAERIVVQLPAWTHSRGTERTKNTIISIIWSGACVESKRDGEDVLTWIEDTTTKTRSNERAEITVAVTD